MNEPQVKALIIDFNDTISPSNFAQSFALFEAETGWTGQQLGRKYIDAGLLLPLMQGKVREYEFWVQVSQLTGISLSILLEYASIILKTKQIDTAFIDVLVQCKACYNFPLVLLTDNVQEMFSVWREQFQLAQMFDYIVNSADYGVTKKESEIYHIVLDMLNITAENALFIDDDLSYLQVAQSLGFQVFHHQGLESTQTELIRRGLFPKV